MDDAHLTRSRPDRLPPGRDAPPPPRTSLMQPVTTRPDALSARPAQSGWMEWPEDIVTAPPAAAPRRDDHVSEAPPHTAGAYGAAIAKLAEARAWRPPAGLLARLPRFAVAPALPPQLAAAFARARDALPRGPMQRLRAVPGLLQQSRDALRNADWESKRRATAGFMHRQTGDGRFDTLFPLDVATPLVLSGGPIEQLVPLPRRGFASALASIVPLDGALFIDISTGRGRTLMLAATHDFERILGLAWTDDEASEAARNVAQFPRSAMRCRDVEIRRADREQFALPARPIVLCAGGPLRAGLLAQWVHILRAAHGSSVMLLADTPAAEAREAGLAPVRVPHRARLAMGALSPVPLALYRAT